MVRLPMRTGVAAAIATSGRMLDLLVCGGTPTRGEIKQGPERLNGSEVSRILSRIAWRVDQLACPMRADRAIWPPPEGGHHWNRLAVGPSPPWLRRVERDPSAEILRPRVARQRLIVDRFDAPVARIV
jgi:hypothetical protein